jgi:hypothetical protein
MLFWSPLLNIGIIWDNFKISGKEPVENDLLTNAAIGTDKQSLAIFKSFTGKVFILVEVFFNLDIIFEISKGVT